MVAKRPDRKGRPYRRGCKREWHPSGVQLFGFSAGVVVGAGAAGGGPGSCCGA